jgi:hypothetical protein
MTKLAMRDNLQKKITTGTEKRRPRDDSEQGVALVLVLVLVELINRLCKMILFKKIKKKKRNKWI